MNSLATLFAAIATPAVIGALTLTLPRRSITLRTAAALLGPVGALVLLASYAAGQGGAIGPAPVSAAWMPELRLDLALNPDKLGLFFALLVAGIGVLVTVYARAYFGPDADSLRRFFPSLHLFMTAMLGVALADNFMLLLLFWELTSVSSFLLIGWDRDDPSAVQKAMQAFVVTGAGGLCLMAGLILTGVHTGAWSFSALLAMRASIEPSATLAAALILIFAGAAAKSAQWPLHFWLPGAMAAPTPVSAYLHSATMVKAGVYLVGRLWPILALAVPLWPKLIVPFGAVTMVMGAYVALRKSDLKQIFAYTTVSQLGLLMTMYGLGAVQVGHDGHVEHNLIWDVSQILNHALYKAPLFIMAGAIGHIASRDLAQLKGLVHRGRTQRIMCIVILLAAYALAAGPLTISFTAKEFFFSQIWHAVEASGNPWLMILIPAGVATGMFNVAIFIRLAVTMLGRSDESHDADHGHAHHEQADGFWPAFLWLPAVPLVAIQYAGGIVPGLFEKLFLWLEPHAGYHDGHFPLAWEAHIGVPLFMSAAAIALGVGLGFAPVLRRVVADPHDRIYPAFYKLCTRGGGRVFGLVQTGHARSYVLMVFIAIIGLFAWAVARQGPYLEWWPREARFEALGDLFPGYLVTGLVCLTAVLMPIVQDRTSRVLVLGSCGFSVTAVYYLYKAPDLALTQISIEIVSLILFLLVLSLLPKRGESGPTLIVPRVVVAVGVGVAMFWMTLTSSVGTPPASPFVTSDGGRPLAHLGEFFLRNSNVASDTSHWQATATDGVVVRGRDETGRAMLHAGGGGRNVVNVILVDGRGFDTMGEITVLGLAALGVWTLLRRHRRHRPTTQAQTQTDAAGLSLPIPDPRREAGGHDELPAEALSRSVSP